MIERPPTMTEMMVYACTPVFVAAIHTAEHGCRAFSIAADAAEAAAATIALHSIGVPGEIVSMWRG